MKKTIRVLTAMFAVSYGLMFIAPSAQAGYLETVISDWEDTGAATAEVPDGNGNLCRYWLQVKMARVYEVHEDGTRTLVDEYPVGYQLDQRCRPESEGPAENPSWWSDDWSVEDNWHYLGSSGWDSNCRCWEEYWGFRVVEYRDWYYGYDYQYTEYLGEHWETATYYYSD